MAEIEVEGHQRPNLAPANLEQPAVFGAAELLIADGHHIVAGGAQNFATGLAEILVEFEFHSAGTGRIRSRAISAP